MAPSFMRKTRSGCSFLEILAADNPEDIAVLQLDFAVDMDSLARQAVDDADSPEGEELLLPSLASESVSSSPTVSEDGSRPLKAPEPATSTTTPLKRAQTSFPESPTKRVCISLDPEPLRPQSARNRRRAQRRVAKKEKNGHPRGSGRAFQQFVLNAEPIKTELDSEGLPIAEGGWVATNCSYYGAKVKRELEKMKALGFTHIPWKGRTPICAVDSQNRLVLVAAGGPNDPTYWDDAAKMSELMLKMGAETKWEPAEKHCRRGDFPSVAYGWSYGKGQPMPQRLGGKHQEMMADFISQPCVQRIASYQSASFSLWFPKAYGEFHQRNIQLKEKIPSFHGNIKGSVYSCCTANCGPNTWTHIHRDTMNSPGPCCAITSGGPYDPEKGGQLIVWDLKLIFDFPPGSTILLPSALF